MTGGGDRHFRLDDAAGDGTCREALPKITQGISTGLQRTTLQRYLAEDCLG